MDAMQPVVEAALPRAGKLRLLVNFAAFQAGWFACVLGAAHGWPWGGSAIGLAVVAGHLLSVPGPLAEFKLVAAAILIGMVWDSSLAASGWVGYAPGGLFPGAAPNWILVLWALFATTLNVSLRWLQGRWVLAALIGGVAGPLSYCAGVRLGALVFVEPTQAVLALAAGWAALTPVLLLLARRNDGMSTAKLAQPGAA
jgi:hypothetical protein